MAGPGVVPGGSDIKDFAAYPDGNASCGVFSNFPGATPKYALNKGPRDAEYRETMARLFVQVPETERKDFVSSCPPETRPLAEVLCGGGPSAASATGFIDFLLTSVQESFQEKVQVVESLSDNFIIYTFGQKAPTFSYGGTLLNTYQDDQRVWMMRLYQDILRGTQLARRRKLARLRYDSVIVSGVFIMHTQSLQGDWRDYAQFQFSFIPTQYVIFTPALGKPTTHGLDGKTLGAFNSSKAFMLTPAAAANNDQLRVASAKQATYPTAAPAAEKPAVASVPPPPVNNPQQKLESRASQPASSNPLFINNLNVRGGMVVT
jgi:hypothetical protein